jgi:hypothetical protein
VFTADPAASFNCGLGHGVIGSETTVVQPLGHRGIMFDRVERGFSQLVMSLKPERATSRFALATAPALVSQWQTPSVTCHVTKIAFQAWMSSQKAKFQLR